MTSATTRGTIPLALALALFYVALHPYRGIVGDALIYVTHEWAGRADAALAQDMLFANDRQTALTFFAPLMRALLRLAPVDLAAQIMAFLGVALWCLAAANFCRAFAHACGLDDRAALAMGALIAVAPLTYAATPSFSAGEHLAVPRPFAEACVLALAAALLRSRRVVALGFALAAALFHPLIGATGVGLIVFTSLARRPAAMGGFVLLALAVAIIAAAVLPTFDADWRALLDARAYYLFLTQAPESFWSDLAWRACVVLLVWRGAQGVPRDMLGGLIVACLLALAVAFVADFANAAALVQAQPWRMTWLLALVAPACVVVFASRAKDGADRLALACLACAFAWRDLFFVSAPFSLAAFVVVARASDVRARLVGALWIFAAAGWCLLDLWPATQLLRAWAETPNGASFDWALLWGLAPLALPVALLLRTRVAQAPASIIALVALAGALALHDNRSAYDRDLEAGRAPRDMQQLAPPSDAAILWLGGGKESWYWLRRPNWAAAIQGSSVVFSEELAALWSERARALVALKLEPESFVDHRRAAASQAPDREALRAICARDDAPALIVWSLREGEAPMNGARIMDGPAHFAVDPSGERLRFVRRSTLVTLECSSTLNAN